MAVKRRREKKQYKRWLDKNAFKIMCKYCEHYNTCTLKDRKEKDEQISITRCTVTPNKKPKKLSWEKYNKKGEVININKHGIPINRWFQEEQIRYEEKRKEYKNYKQDSKQQKKYNKQNKEK